MKGKLIKHGHSYALVIDSKMIAFAHPEEFNNGHVIGKLSLKNCQAIENGYDLEELWKETIFSEKISLDSDIGNSFKLGFQKALEIFGENKFTEEDMRRALSAGLSIGYGRQFEIENKQIEIDNYIQSLQQTEWDVEIVMEEKENIELSSDATCIEDSNFILRTQFVKLDENNRIILKRKV